MVWLLWIDDEIRGYTNTTADAKWWLTKISTELVGEIKKDIPTAVIKIISISSIIEIRCIDPGYFFDTTWGRTISYTPVYKLTRPKRAPNFDIIDILEKSSKPATRPPTPIPFEESELHHDTSTSVPLTIRQRIRRRSASLTD